MSAADETMRNNFNEEIRSTFCDADVDGDGLLNREEFEQCIILADKYAQRAGHDSRIVTKGWYDMYFEGFNGYNQSVEGVSYEEYKLILGIVTLKSTYRLERMFRDTLKKKDAAAALSDLMADSAREEEKKDKVKRRKLAKKQRAKMQKLAKKQGKTIQEMEQTLADQKLQER